ncbi:MAG: Methylcobalamin:coenzyme M methyltransferase MtbA [Candidatus Methanohalarchaeum thermophilum]|uniref:Methylcobalamin:coenzyme M methyltransferase MtbA n=1 Tax=Methanohalarchaeum thermophilum TaxID=1903181 RepID=A0A1Q6DWW2_METT1|nr:MAG: Methylcobalamin:coenzyme M methyltransferase MtbA [Candidatus Methanohalarchaeum thermophilum]
MKEELSSEERWKALLKGDPVDRVPVMPLVLGQSALVCGYENLGDFYSKPEVHVKCQLRAKEMFGYGQPLIAFPTSYKHAAVWGSEIEHPYREAMGSIAVHEPVVETAEELEELEIPDPREGKYMEEFFDMVEMVIEKGEVKPFVYLTTGITATAPVIVGTEKFMMWLRKEPSLCEVALDKATEFVQLVTEELVNEFGADSFIPWTSFPNDANILISPDTFGELILPRVQEHHEFLLDLGLPMIYTHWCSDHNGNIEAGHIDKIPMGDPGIIHFGPEVDVAKVVERFGDKSVILGNVSPPSIQKKSFKEVMKLCKENIKKGIEADKGYLLGCGCELPPFAPPINTYAMIKAAREYGQY